MKKARRNRVIFLVMEMVFILCALLFLVVFLVCEPYDRIPVGVWLGGCIFMAVEMHLARKPGRQSQESSQDETPAGTPPPNGPA